MLPITYTLKCLTHRAYKEVDDNKSDKHTLKLIGETTRNGIGIDSSVQLPFFAKSKQFKPILH